MKRMLTWPMMIFFGLVVLTCLTALYEATMRDRAADAAQAAHLHYCQQINALVIAEFDEIVASGKFPTDGQQDRWRQLSHGCE